MSTQHHRPAHLEVKIVGRRRQALRPTEFEISVVVPGHKSWVVRRRYSCFLALDSILRFLYPELPAIPPKSRIRKRILPAFMEDREKRLGEWLQSLLAADPHASGVELQRFLGFLGNLEPLTDEEEEQEDVSEASDDATAQHVVSTQESPGGTRRICPAGSTSLADLVGSDAQVVEVCCETFHTLAPRGVGLSIISEGDEYYEFDLDDTCSTEASLACWTESLKFQNSQLEAENLMIRAELKVAALNVERRRATLGGC